MPVQAQDSADPKSEISIDNIESNIWALRPCFIYKEEYDDCRCMQARFHQYFIHGDSVDCLQWKRDYDNCVRFEKDNGDLTAVKDVLQSEANRRTERMRAHYQNTTWKKRTAPPEEWKKPLPQWMVEKNKNTYLEVKANELLEAEKGGRSGFKEDRTLCVIM